MVTRRNASPPSLLVSGPVETSDLAVSLVLSDEVTDGVLHVTAQAASCDTDVAENPACYLARQDWGVPVRLVDGSAGELTLMLLG